MSVVVSANYRDRSQKNWLVRQSGDALDQYELRDRVVVKDFRFCKSFMGEVGFGCNTVAVGELGTLDVAIDQLVRISFDGHGFAEVGSDVSIKGGSLLVLDETGMYYLPA